MAKAHVIEAYVRAVAARNPYTWARAHRIMPDGLPYTIRSGRYCMPYLDEVYRAIGQLPHGGRIAVQKAAQTGWTEAALNTTFWFLDVKQEGVLYMLPTDRQLSDFAQARVNKAVSASPYISSHCQDVSNVQLKVIFGQPLYLRGSMSHEKLLEIPVGLVVRDEYEMMDREGAELALSRLGASQHKWVFDLGNPRFPESGINAAWLGGTQEVWELQCPRCGLWAEPRWPESVDAAKKQLVCPECGAPVDRTKGRWRALNPGAPYRSFRMSQLVSPAVDYAELLQAWKEAQGNATQLQVFYNMRLGLPYTPEGTKITDEMIAALPRLPNMPAGSARKTVMGVDVGAVLHVVIRYPEGGTIYAGTTDWTGLAAKMVAYNVQKCFIDAMPETTKAKEFARQFPGKVVLVRYLAPQATSSARTGSEDGVPVLFVRRTEALDAALAKIINREEPVAANLPEEFWRHIKSLTRQIVKSSAGEYAVWVESGPDHYAHAFCYATLGEGKTVKSKIDVGKDTIITRSTLVW